jgi:thiol-disulfide isomerase/thioredoxin
MGKFKKQKIMKKLTILLLILIPFSFGSKLLCQPTVGQKAPALTGLKLIDKKLPNLDNKFVFIDFWATWCSPCRKSLPHVNKLAEKYKEKVVFFAISDEKEMEVRQFLQKNNFNSLIFGLDIQGDLFSKFEIKSVPQYYLLSPQNEILASGYSSEISDEYLDSVITNYNTGKLTIESKIEISEDSIEKVSSVEIFEKSGMTKYLSQSGYTFIVRDSLNIILPYLTGVKLANRIQRQNLPKRMIEVKIFSRNTPFDSLKMIAHNQIMASYGISKKSIVENTTVYNFQLKNSGQLKNKNTYIEPGVASKRELVNGSTYRFDNYTFKDLVSFLEAAYFPRLFYAISDLTDVYDWDLQIFNPITHSWVSFDELKKILKKECGVEIKETKNNETFTIYN